jgi:hypothetical protein
MFPPHAISPTRLVAELDFSAVCIWFVVSSKIAPACANVPVESPVWQ